VTIALSGLLPERKSQVSIGLTRKTGNRLKQQNVDSETGEVVSRDAMVRVYEVAKGSAPEWSQALLKVAI